MYLLENEQLDDLPTLARNGTSSSTSSSVSKFDLWFARLEPSTFEQKNKNALKSVYDQMIAMDNSFPPFIRLCNLLENSRGIILAHFIHEADQVLGNYLQANSRGLLMTAFQRAFRIFDAKHAINSMSSMISWKSHPSYARVKEQCTIQLQKDAKIPLAHKSKATSPMDLKTYKCFLENVTARLSQTFGVNLQEYIKYCNAYFAATTLMFGGPRGLQELADLSILFFCKVGQRPVGISSVCHNKGKPNWWRLEFLC